MHRVKHIILINSQSSVYIFLFQIYTGNIGSNSLYFCNNISRYVQPDFTSYSGQYSYAAEASMDSTLYIDYGAIDAYNYAMQAPEVVPNIPQKGKGSALDIKQTIFNQVDRNHDGSISRDEFLQWSQAGQQGRNVQGAAAYTNNQQSYAQSSFVNNNDSNLDITSILQQSGLTQPTNRWQ